MATEAQIAANRMNAQASPGPTTATGRARSSRNAISSGLYSRGDFVLSGEETLYAEFCAGFQTDLEPEGAIEQTLSAEIIHAAWRLRRCSAVAASMTGSLDPMVDPAVAQTQQAIDRARNDAHRTFQRGIAELRRLQTERQFRFESFPEDYDVSTLGLASFKDMAPALLTETQRHLLRRKLAATHTPSDRRGAAPQPPNQPDVHNTQQTAPTNQTQSVAGLTDPLYGGLSLTALLGRNSPCDCGSGIKFKRCCGKGAPAVLNPAA